MFSVVNQLFLPWPAFRNPDIFVPLLAITGGIATGKSTCTRLLAAGLGARTYDTDMCARRLLAEDQDVARELRAAFDTKIFDPEGRIDRAALRQRIFASTEERRKLEGIIHPRVRVAWTQWTREQLQNAPDTILLVEIPLLYETAAAALFDQTIVVGCSLKTQVTRLTSERRLPHETARQIIASQWPLAEKVRLGDRLIWNDGSAAGLQRQIEFCVSRYRAASF